MLPISQNDGRWKDRKIGTRKDGKTLTIGNWGCLLVAYQMWLQYHDIATLPPMELRAAFMAVGRYTTGYFSGGDLKAAFPEFVIDERWEQRQGARDLTPQIVAYMQKHQTPVPIRVDFRPKTAIYDQHWVLAIGIEDGRLVIADPDKGDIVRIDKRYNIRGGDILEALWLRPTSKQRNYPLGIDVSHHQRGIDYEALAKKDGVTFAIVRYAYGSNPDSMHQHHVTELRTAGIGSIAAYCWLRHDESVQKQVGAWVDLFRATPVDWLAVDVEENGLTVAQVQDAINGLAIAEIPTIDYSSASKWRSIMHNADHAHRDQWQARYESSRPLAYGGHEEPAIWQYSHHGTLHGHKSIDLNKLLAAWPHSSPVQSLHNLLPYFIGHKSYRVRGSDGREQIFSYRPEQDSWQPVLDGNGIFWLLKDRQGEQFRVRDGMLQRGWDTSESDERMYAQWHDISRSELFADWLPLLANAGDVSVNRPFVQHYDKATGKLLNGGYVESKLTIESLGVLHIVNQGRANHQQFDDCLVLKWESGERYVYARDVGLIYWTGRGVVTQFKEWADASESLDIYPVMQGTW